MNRPIVRTMQPQEKNISTGRIMAFTNPRITAIRPTAIQAFWLSMRMPGISQTAATSATAVITQRMTSFIVFPLNYLRNG
jgi:hypothetical protein